MLLAAFNASCFLQIGIQLHASGIHFCAQGAQLACQFSLKACADASSLFIQHGLGQILGVCCNCGENVLVEHIQCGSSLDGNGGAVVFQQDFHTGFNFSFSKDVVLSKESHVLFAAQIRQSLRSGFQVQQATFSSFSHPFIGVTIAVEDDALVSQVGFFNQIIYGSLQVRSIGQLSSELLQLFGNDSVQHNVGTSDGEHGAQHTELEFVAGEGEGRGSVSIGIILNQSRNGVIANLHEFSRVAGVNLISSDCFQNCGQLGAQEYGNDCRRSLVGAQTMVVTSASYGYTQQVLVFINSLQNSCQEGQEAQVLVGLLAGIQQVHALFSS